MEDSWYEKLAKAGWLGTKAQVSAQYGSPTWSNNHEQEDPYSKALKNVAKKPAPKDSGET